MQPHEKGRPGGSEAANQQVGKTTTSVPRSWHEQCDWENEHQYAEGWAAGYAAGWQAVADEVARATGVKPYRAKEVIAWLCRCIDLDYRQRNPEPYSSSANGTTLTVSERQSFGELGRVA